ncbi:ParA family protein [Flammeovirgaceae bacterium SG7u.111]|nr:ParA family protein [Flammeovirgaceae bacterium SG7u.132]WPO37324.1 ParA family protein [Flammeovirgaceae bacterium SG7u.111]
MRIISIANNKGGIGKTTSTVNIGAGIALGGKKVLLVDLDPQANLSKSLGVREPEKTIYESLTEETDIPIVSISENLDLAPATLKLSKAETQLDPAQGDHFILKEQLEKLDGTYDYVYIDCPPSLSILTMSALLASTEVFVPVQSEFLSLEGLASLTESLEKITKRLNPQLKVTGVFATRFDSRKVLNRNVVEVLEQQFPNELFKTKIRDNIALAEAPSKRMDIFRYAPYSYGAKDYADLCVEILERHSKA